MAKWLSLNKWTDMHADVCIWTMDVFCTSKQQPNLLELAPCPSRASAQLPSLAGLF